MKTYYTLAMRPMGSKCFTIHPGKLYSASYEKAQEKLESLVHIPEDDLRIATVFVEENEEDRVKLLALEEPPKMYVTP